MRVLLVDDHPVVRSGIRRLLADALAGLEFVETGDSRQAVIELERGPFDLVVLDLGLPHASGIDGLQAMVQARPGVKILIYTMHAEAHYAARAFRAGAAGYLTKDSSSDEVIAAARKVCAGGKYVSTAMAERLASSLSGGDVTAKPHERLSDREEQVLRLLTEGHAVKAIASELHLSIKTISTYRTRILEKLDAHSTADLVRYAVLEGLVE